MHARELENVEALLTAAIPESRNPNRHVLAGRTLVCAHLRQWDVALVTKRCLLLCFHTR
jgi:putative SOS response-associated peptidase YedK